MPRPSPRLIPAVVLGLGSLLLLAAKRQEVMPLRAPLTSLPTTLAGRQSVDLSVSPEEQAIAGMTSYVTRVFGDAPGDFSVYVGYYDAQIQGKSIHSPKNCLPGAGWEPVAVSSQTIALEGTDTATVNRYILERGTNRALVYYWYQGRGRVAWNEYRVKWELLRDKALSGRSEEALVRLVIPIDRSNQSAADSLAIGLAQSLIPKIFQILPAY